MQLPTDVFQNPDIQQLFQEVQAYQQQFVLLHKASTANQPQGEDPATLKARLLQLDSQKQQLKDKLTKARGKVANVPNLTVLQVWRHAHIFLPTALPLYLILLETLCPTRLSVFSQSGSNCHPQYPISEGCKVQGLHLD